MELRVTDAIDAPTLNPVLDDLLLREPLDLQKFVLPEMRVIVIGARDIEILLCLRE